MKRILLALPALLAAATTPAAAATLTRAHAVLPASHVRAAAGATLAETAPDVGARSVGDEIFPAIGHGVHQLSGTTTITAVATQPLREFSLDFQGFTITALTVDGKPAVTRREGTKLIVDPATPLADGDTFTVAVTYSGTPETVTDQDGSD